jgi:hypothetical protein
MMLYMPTFTSGKVLLFGVLVLCSAVEKLCSIMNLVAIERDWVRSYIDSFGKPFLTVHRWL